MTYIIVEIYPGRPNEVGEATFCTWLDQADPDCLDAFGRSWFPYLWKGKIRIKRQKPPLLVTRSQGPRPTQSPKDVKQ